MANKPEVSIKVGSLNFSVWKNKTAKGDIKSITITRTYKKGEAWETTNSFRPQDIVLLQSGLSKLVDILYTTKFTDNSVETETNEEEF